jgi:hypothetical protein
MSKAREEQTKLSANLCNAAAGSSFTVGVVGPLVAVFLNLGDAQSKVPLVALALNAIFWFVIAALLHRFGRRILNRLDL